MPKQEQNGTGKRFNPNVPSAVEGASVRTPLCTALAAKALGSQAKALVSINGRDFIPRVAEGGAALPFDETFSITMRVAGMIGADYTAPKYDGVGLNFLLDVAAVLAGANENFFRRLAAVATALGKAQMAADKAKKEVTGKGSKAIKASIKPHQFVEATTWQDSDGDRHKVTKQDLIRTLDQIDQWHERIAGIAEPLSKMVKTEKDCDGPVDIMLLECQTHRIGCKTDDLITIMDKRESVDSRKKTAKEKKR